MTLFLVSAGSDFVCWGRREIERKITAKEGSSKNKMEKKKTRGGHKFRKTAPMRQGGKLNPCAVSSN